MRWYQTWQHYPLLHKMNLMKDKTTLIDEGFEPVQVPLRSDGMKFWISCMPKSGAGRRSSHRIMVHCVCDRLVPFGRMGQHYTSSRCWGTKIDKPHKIGL